jgi:hypothetical protein
MITLDDATNLHVDATRKLPFAEASKVLRNAFPNITPLELRALYNGVVKARLNNETLEFEFVPVPKR